MKQIDECLDRVFEGKKPLSKKWKCLKFTEDFGQQVEFYTLYHYQHIVLVYCITTNTIIYEWWEKPTDKRGLDAARTYLIDRCKATPLT